MVGGLGGSWKNINLMHIFCCLAGEGAEEGGRSSRLSSQKDQSVVAYSV